MFKNIEEIDIFVAK